VTTWSLLSLTRAIFRSAELGFLGFMTVTRMHTPFMHGRLPFESAGDTGLRARACLRQPLSTWLKVAQRRDIVGAIGVGTRANVRSRGISGKAAATGGRALAKAVRSANIVWAWALRCSLSGKFFGIAGKPG